MFDATFDPVCDAVLDTVFGDPAGNLFADPTGAAPAVPVDVAGKVQGFAELVAAHQPVAATDAMLEWVGTDEDRARYFATTAVTMVAARIRATMRPRPGDYWVLRPGTGEPHNTAMCQVVVRIVNGEPGVAQNLLTAHHLVHGTTGLLWLGVFAVRMLANLLPNDTRST